MPQEASNTSGASDALHEIRNQLTIVKSKLYLADPEVKRSSFYGDMSRHVQVLSTMLHQLSLLQELEEQAYPFERVKVGVSKYLQDLRLLAPKNTAIETQDSDADISADKELLYQLGFIVAQSAWDSGARSLGVKLHEASLSFAYAASDTTYIKPMARQLIAAICECHGGDAKISSEKKGTTITCRLGL